ncbi:class I SAM-dependent methyltransferase [Brevundimonas sp. R86498]|uniref:class I SAM-dependent methyltransferase n=1 Tax=Brevundimonas sp. R86498 TaxID=3093845 RepID=UPI0037CA7658
MTVDVVLRGYADDAEGQIARMEGLDPAVLLAPVMAVLPARPGRMLDVGAGTGYIAGWFADRGHRATAVEPVAAFRNAGSRIRGDRVRWINDRLPEMQAVRALAEQFDLIVLSAVWHHLDAAARPVAMAGLAVRVAAGGRIILSLRHGQGTDTRPGFPVSATETIRLAERHGLGVRLAVEAESIQPLNRARGVSWTWLALDR